MASHIEDLLDLDTDINEIWEELSEKCPELTEQLKERMAVVDETVRLAKVELRKRGPGAHKFGEHTFSVKKGGVSTSFDAVDVSMLAEERGETQLLLDSGFLHYSVNSSQFTRIPRHLQGVYGELRETKNKTEAVYLPKTLCRF